MNVLIVENDVYLAQKIVSRLLDDGHNCDYVEMPSGINNLTKDYDVVLLATPLPNSLCKEITKKYSQKSIVLLLVSYMSDKTVTNLIKHGVKDYIMKPFMMDELIRKIYHYVEARDIKIQLQTLNEYLNFTMQDIEIEETLLSSSFPLLVESNSQKYADKVTFELSKKLNLPICFISLSSSDWLKQINSIKEKAIIYMTNYHSLKRNQKDDLNKYIEDKTCIISTLEKDDTFPYKKITINNEESIINKIMTINDYIKMIVTHHQNRYPDTELSQKLGISRKSLWEKRKKLGIERKK
jgi:DNA-binding NtrC family response regulator